MSNLLQRKPTATVVGTFRSAGNVPMTVLGGLRSVRDVPKAVIGVVWKLRNVPKEVVGGSYGRSRCVFESARGALHTE